MEIKRRIVWDESALDEFIHALKWISKQSIQGAEIVEKGILDAIDVASNNPEHFPPDKYKKNNPGNFRAFEIHSYRISFLYKSNEIQILRVRHTRQKPKSY